MGLDMYLCGEIYFSEYPPQGAKRIDIEYDGYRIKEARVDLGYWRKHPNLHGYICQTFAGGVDECQKIQLTLDDLRDIKQAIIDKKLPHTTGFFFGESFNTEEERQEDLKIIDKAIKFFDNDDTWRSVYYQASW